MKYTMKDCVKCGYNKAVVCFSKHPLTADGFDVVCLECRYDQRKLKRTIDRIKINSSRSKASSELRDWYIATVLRQKNFPNETIINNRELIEIQRLLIKTKRELKNIPQ